MMDELVLAVQRWVDRLARWARLPVPGGGEAPRFLIVQIDGLSRRVLEQALRTRRAPGLGRLLASGRLRWRDLAVGLPTSTPFFQAALMYGARPDIPGFHYYDKRARADRYFPRPGVADLVEEGLAREGPGILAGGACYGCVFTGGAAESLWTFARLLRPTRAGRALGRAPLSLVLLGWVVCKCLALTAVEVTRAVLRLIADPLGGDGRGLRWLLFKIGLSIWTRQLFTLAVSNDLYRGTPAIYVNYLEYDVFAHAFGPEHPLALGALRRVDRSVAQLARILRRLPERRYDLYVLSDHGQAPTRPFRRLSGGASIEETVRALLARGADRAPAGGGAARPEWAAQWGALREVRGSGLLQRFLTYLERDFPAWVRGGGAADPGGVRIVAAGPNAFVYFTDTPEPLGAEAIERRAPGLAPALSRHPGVGFVLARSAAGPVCWYRGTRTLLEAAAAGGPFDGRLDRATVVAGLRELMAMPSAGDLVLYGTGAPGGDVSYLDERGAHAGPSTDELWTFLLHPPHVSLPAGALTHPVQLHPHFAAYAREAVR